MKKTDWKFVYYVTEKLNPINNNIKKTVQSLFENVKIDDNRLPAALCSSCKRKITYAVSDPLKNHGRDNEYKKIKIADASLFSGEKRGTRLKSNEKCFCNSCK